MTKIEINQAIASKTNLSLSKIASINDALFEVIMQEVSQGNKVTFKYFGTFKPKKRAAKKVQLFQEQKTISLPEHFIPAFLPAESFCAKVK
jgi:DNA-binding protein HU-beta